MADDYLHKLCDKKYQLEWRIQTSHSENFIEAAVTVNHISVLLGKNTDNESDKTAKKIESTQVQQEKKVHPAEILLWSTSRLFFPPQYAS